MTPAALPPHRRRRALVVAGGVVATLVAAGLIHRPSVTDDVHDASRPAQAPPPAVSASPAGESAIPASTVIATLTGVTAAYPRPDLTSPHHTQPQTWLGGVSALPVIDERPGWLHVLTPQRPNGSSSWIRRNSVILSRSTDALHLSLASKTLTRYRDGNVVARMPAGIGRPATPTPLGRFFVAVLKESPGPQYGPFVMITSAHSETIEDLQESGDAVVSIHGPIDTYTQIESGGAAVSLGCIRLRTQDLLTLRDVPLGTPFIVTA